MCPSAGDFAMAVEGSCVDQLSRAYLPLLISRLCGPPGRVQAGSRVDTGSQLLLVGSGDSVPATTLLHPTSSPGSRGPRVPTALGPSLKLRMSQANLAQQRAADPKAPTFGGPKFGSLWVCLKGWEGATSQTA